jgi:hypothetical protein
MCRTALTYKRDLPALSHVYVRAQYHVQDAEPRQPIILRVCANIERWRHEWASERTVRSIPSTISSTTRVCSLISFFAHVRVAILRTQA